MKKIENTILEGRSALLGYIKKKVGDPDLAEDILQESMVKALRSAPELRDEEKVIPWFYRIVDNAIIDSFRRRRVERNYLERIAGEEEPSVTPEEERRICACIKDIIPTLKPEYAELVEELELRDEDPAVVAERIGITRNNLKVRRHRARTQLRERLEAVCRSCATHGCLDCTCRT